MDVATDQTLTVADVVAMTGFSRSHVYRHLVDFGGIRVGDAVRCSRAVVEALIPYPQNSAAAGATNTAAA